MEFVKLFKAYYETNSFPQYIYIQYTNNEECFGNISDDIHKICERNNQEILELDLNKKYTEEEVDMIIKYTLGEETAFGDSIVRSKLIKSPIDMEDILYHANEET